MRPPRVRVLETVASVARPAIGDGRVAAQVHAPGRVCLDPSELELIRMIGDLQKEESRETRTFSGVNESTRLSAMNDSTPHPLTTKHIREGWTELLSRYEWDCFATLTFKNARRDPFEVVNAFRIWLYKWSLREAESRHLAFIEKRGAQDNRQNSSSRKRDRITGPFVRAWKRGKAVPIWVLGIEAHRTGSLHLHAIIKSRPFLSDLTRRVGWEIWKLDGSHGGMGMGLARLEPPRSQGDVRGYVSKYVTKGGEIVLGDSFNASMIA